MDPALQAAYQGGYAAAASRRMTSSVISTATSTASAALRPTDMITKVSQTTAERAANISFFKFIALLPFVLVMWPLHLLWLWILRPLFFYAVLPPFALIALVAAVRLIFWLDFGGMGERMKERYDDFALDNDWLLSLEHGYASFRRALDRLWLDLRYNETMDRVIWIRNEIYFLPDTIERYIKRHWYLVPLVICTVGWIWWVKSLQAVYVPMNRLSPRLAKGIPPWVTSYWDIKKYEGSNSHYRRDEKLAEAITYEEWIKAIGNDDSAILESAVETQTITVERTPETETITVSETVSSVLEAVATDYWAPPKGKTDVGDEMVWCRNCKQWHCCELPY